MPTTGGLVEVIVAVCLSVVIGFLSLGSYLYGLVRYGPSVWLSVKKRNNRPSLLDSDAFGRHHWTALKHTRLKLHYVDNGLEDRPLMLFIHGFPEFWYSWRHQLKEFGKDYRTVAVDMRGYGDSDKPSAIREYMPDRLADDVEELVQILGHEKCIVVGHDWGGAVAWYFASKYSSRVEKLIICNCPHPLAFRRHLSSSFSQLTKSWYVFFFLVPVLPILTLRAFDLRRIAYAFCGKSMGAKPGTFTPEDIEAYKYTFAEYSDLVGPVNYYRASLLFGNDLVWPEAKLRSPVLMVWGTKDGALERKMADLSGDYVDRYSVEYIEGASHWVQQEEPEKTNAFIRKFLKEE